MGSRIIESAACCNQILSAQLYISRAQITSVNWIIRLLVSLLCRPKMIPLSGGHCTKLLDRYDFVGKHMKLVPFCLKKKKNAPKFCVMIFFAARNTICSSNLARSAKRPGVANPWRKLRNLGQKLTNVFFYSTYTRVIILSSKITLSTFRGLIWFLAQYFSIHGVSTYTVIDELNCWTFDFDYSGLIF
jgi:hypothetical protein